MRGRYPKSGVGLCPECGCAVKYRNTPRGRVALEPRTTQVLIRGRQMEAEVVHCCPGDWRWSVAWMRARGKLLDALDLLDLLDHQGGFFEALARSEGVAWIEQIDPERLDELAARVKVRRNVEGPQKVRQEVLTWIGAKEQEG